jgi:hypothetical protein
VIGLIVLVVAHLALTFRRAFVARNQSIPSEPGSSATKPGVAAFPRTNQFDLGLLLSLGATALFGAGIAIAFEFEADSRLVPLLAAIPGIVAAMALVATHLRGRAAVVEWPVRNEVAQIGLLAACIAAIPFAGFYVAIAAYVLALLWLRTSLRLLLVPYAAAIVAGAYGLAHIVNLQLP